MPEAYKTLERRFARVATLREAAAMLHWDAATLMPAGSAAGRADQLATLAVLAHEGLTAPEIGDLLDAAEEEPEALDDWQGANLREMRRQWVHATAVPADLVEALSRASKTCEMAWREARPASDFAAVRPHLQRLLDLVRESAAAKAEALGKSPYEALLDQFEPEGSTARIDSLFAELADFLPDFLPRVLERQAAAPAACLPSGPFPQEKQKALAEDLMRAVGFDFGRGRLDTSLHPFCGGVPDDVRITTRYDEADFTSAVMGVLHETGHALYEANLPAEWRHQPVGEARGMTLHESQSLLIEMQVCRGRDFLAFAAPLMREAFGGEGPDWELANIERLMTRVEPGFIRVDADEVTYPAHVILRYRLERAMIAGDLALEDLPGAWNDGLEGLLGIRPPEDRLGCLQDIHWYDGAFGYFPTYTLGALAAAQLFQAAQDQDPEIPAALAEGDFVPLRAWLRKAVHARASSASTDEILTAATGAPLSLDAFKAHLAKRYLGAET